MRVGGLLDPSERPGKPTIVRMAASGGEPNMPPQPSMRSDGQTIYVKLTKHRWDADFCKQPLWSLDSTIAVCEARVFVPLVQLSQDLFGDKALLQVQLYDFGLSCTRLWNHTAPQETARRACDYAMEMGVISRKQTLYPASLFFLLGILASRIAVNCFYALLASLPADTKRLMIRPQPAIQLRLRTPAKFRLR